VTFEQVSNLKGKVVPQEKIPDIATRLASQLLQQDDGSLHYAVRYSFQEIIRNVIEHSQSETMGYCAQHWLRGPNSDIVELAIIDTGIGLRRSLANNPILIIPDDREAIKFALMPGISGTQPDPSGSNSRWVNSGFGLYMSSRLCSEKGSFFICSGEQGLYFKHGVDNQYFDTDFQGTLLRMRLNTMELGNAESLLRQYSAEGEALAYLIRNKGARITGPTVSKLLNRDFSDLRQPIRVGDRVVHRKAQFGEGIVEELLVLSTQEAGATVIFDNGRRARVRLSDLTRLMSL